MTITGVFVDRGEVRLICENPENSLVVVNAVNVKLKPLWN